MHGLDHNVAHTYHTVFSIPTAYRILNLELPEGTKLLFFVLYRVYRTYLLYGLPQLHAYDFES